MYMSLCKQKAYLYTFYVCMYVCVYVCMYVYMSVCKQKA